MAEVENVQERMLAKVTDGEESREVRLIVGEGLSVIEESQGPVSEAAYGTHLHGHKLLCAEAACRQALGAEGDVAEALAAFFGKGEDAALLSDLMDAFDRAGAPYTYASWSGEGDLAFRGAAQA